VTEYSLADDLSLALALAGSADLISLARFHSMDLEVTTKPDRTPVTDADTAVESSIRAGIAASRPGDSILGEEFGTEGDSRRQWIIDPIDGTANYLRGVPIWATLIALAIDGEPVVGVVSAPALGKRWWAARGAGAFGQEHGKHPVALAVSGIERLEDASISYNNIQGWDGAGRLDALVELQRSVWRARSIGDAWAYMLVAEGKLDVAGEWDLKPYDMAALIPIVEEAGGRFTALTGETGPWHGSALASNGRVHDAVLSTVASALPSIE
jgi:histidinol-phosphatase